MSATADTYHRAASPEPWETVSFSVGRPGCTPWADGIKTLTEAREECATANRTVASGHVVHARQRYVGDLPSLKGTTRSVER